MRFIYQEWDGSEFQSQAHLQFFSNFMDLLIQHGHDALDALRDPFVVLEKHGLDRARADVDADGVGHAAILSFLSAVLPSSITARQAKVAAPSAPV